MTPDFIHKKYELHMIRLPECNEVNLVFAEDTGEPAQRVNLYKYKARWVKHFTKDALTNDIEYSGLLDNYSAS
ncbi:MAG: hypothetical protein ACUVQ6_02795 [Dissulfurimicrobium sp.]|uniref:hypothetical protein n=1 Tax=Dissulfurimicrobium sp. TaxID=2022436 RepID=UPI0040498F42